MTRECACGCGRTLTGRTDQKYLNATHRQRGQRQNGKVRGDADNRYRPWEKAARLDKRDRGQDQAVTGPYRVSNPPNRVTDSEFGMSRIKGIGQGGSMTRQR